MVGQESDVSMNAAFDSQGRGAHSFGVEVC